MSTTLPFDFKVCPIECTLDTIGGKWSINIIRDLFLGKTRFSQFLESNNGLSGKVLSTRLRELQAQGLVEKEVVEITPLRAQYKLTEKGWALGNLLYHLAMYSMNQQPERVYNGTSLHLERDKGNLRHVFNSNPDHSK